MKLELGEHYDGYLYSKNGFLYIQQLFQLPIAQGYNNTPIFKFAVGLEVKMSNGYRNLVRLNNKSSGVNLDCYEPCHENTVLTLLDSSDNIMFYFSDKFEDLIPIISETTMSIVYGMNEQIQYYQRELFRLRQNRDVVSDNKKLS